MIYPHTITILEPDLVADRYGNAVPDYDSVERTEAPAFVQQRTQLTASGETHGFGTDVRVAVVTGWIAFLPPGLPLSSHARLEWDGVTFELDVDGHPNELWTPRGPHHQEVRLRTVQG